MTPEQLKAQIRELSTREVSLDHQLEAFFKLHNAAALVDNKELMNQYREQLHSLIDMKLDTCNSMMQVTRQLIGTMNR